MAFTMHSHSGQFCPGHALDPLSTILHHMATLGFRTLGLSEHMPRYALPHLYPEELPPSHPASGHSSSCAFNITSPPGEPTGDELIKHFPIRHEAYITEALRLRDELGKKYGVHVLIGFEGEWCTPKYATHIRTLIADPRIDYFIGSLHHVLGIPIDYDKPTYAAALSLALTTRESATGHKISESLAEVTLWETYYNEQHDLLTALHPPIVGHMDLIKLLAEDPAVAPRSLPTVWPLIVRNLRVVKEYGGWLEMNTSALRKGLPEPYPGRDIAEKWVAMGGKFTIGDDSHGVKQVATNYGRGLDYLQSLGIKEVWTMRREDKLVIHVPVTLEEFRASLKI